MPLLLVKKSARLLEPQTWRWVGVRDVIVVTGWIRSLIRVGFSLIQLVVIVVTSCLELLLSDQGTSSEILCCRLRRTSDFMAACHAAFCLSECRVLTDKCDREVEPMKSWSRPNQKNTFTYPELSLERKETYRYNLKIDRHHSDSESLHLDIAALFERDGWCQTLYYCLIDWRCIAMYYVFVDAMNSG